MNIYLKNFKSSFRKGFWKAFVGSIVRFQILAIKSVLLTVGHEAAHQRLFVFFSWRHFVHINLIPATISISQLTSVASTKKAQCESYFNYFISLKEDPKKPTLINFLHRVSQAYVTYQMFKSINRPQLFSAFFFFPQAQYIEDLKLTSTICDD